MKPETQSFYEAAVRRAAERVAADLDVALELQALAREAALSPLHFHRIFRGMLGWLPSSGHRVADGMSYEIYRNTPADVSRSELRTELYVPLTA